MSKKEKDMEAKREMGKGYEQTSHRESIFHKNIKIFSMSSVIMKNKIKTSMRYNFITIIWTKIN